MSLCLSLRGMSLRPMFLTFRAPALQTPPKFHEKTPREDKKQRKREWESEKKARNFGLPPFGAPPFGPHSSRPNDTHPDPMDWPTMDWPKLVKSGRPKRDWPKSVPSVQSFRPEHGGPQGSLPQGGNRKVQNNHTNPNTQHPLAKKTDWPKTDWPKGKSQCDPQLAHVRRTLLR